MTYETIRRQDFDQLTDELKEALAPRIAQIKNTFTPVINEDNADALLYGFVMFFKGKQWAFSPEYIETLIDFRNMIESGELSEDTVLETLTGDPGEYMEEDKAEKLLLATYGAISTGLIKSSYHCAIFYIECINEKTYICHIIGPDGPEQKH